MQHHFSKSPVIHSRTHFILVIYDHDPSLHLCTPSSSSDTLSITRKGVARAPCWLLSVSDLKFIRHREKGRNQWTQVDARRGIQFVMAHLLLMDSGLPHFVILRALWWWTKTLFNTGTDVHRILQDSLSEHFSYRVTIQTVSYMQSYEWCLCHTQKSKHCHWYSKQTTHNVLSFSKAIFPLVNSKLND